MKQITNLHSPVKVKKKKKKKKKNPQRRNAEPEVLVPYRLEIELSCRLNAFKFSSYS